MFGFKGIRSPVLKQYIIVIIANFPLFHLGVSLAWLSPVMVNLRGERQTVLPQPLTEIEMAWILSVSALSAISAFSFTGYLTDKLGRKATIIVACIPRLASCLLFMFTSRFWMLLLGRLLCGLSDSVAISVGATYSSEIAGKEIRGGLGAVSQILSSIGAMVMLSIGPFVSFKVINIICTCLIFGTFGPILFLPESPYFLYSNGKLDEAKKLLTVLRGSESSAHEELNEYSSNVVVTVNKKDLLKDVIVLKTIGKVIFLGISSQMVGYNAVTFYLQTIFESTNTSVPPEVSSVVIGCIQLFACFCTILLTDRFGRKPILVISLIWMAVGMVGMGSFFKLQTIGHEITGWLNYLPLVSMMLVIYCFNAGIGSLVWTLMAELFDGPARAFGVSMGVFVANIFMFLTTRYFPSVTNAIGPAITYWMFGGCCVVACLFIAGLVPETKGKAFSEIQRDLGRKDGKEIDASEEGGTKHVDKISKMADKSTNQLNLFQPNQTGDTITN